MKLSHHGGNDSTATSLITALEPKNILASIGWPRGCGVPRASVIERIVNGYKEVSSTSERPKFILTNFPLYAFNHPPFDPLNFAER